MEVIHYSLNSGYLKEQYCYNCWCRLRYTFQDVKKKNVENIDIKVQSHTLYWIECPICGTELDIKEESLPKKPFNKINKDKILNTVI